MRAAFIYFFLLCQLLTLAEGDSIRNINKRKLLVAGGSSAFALTTLVGLNQAWYKQYNTGHFHLFNDNSEWLQMDKCGHAFSTYQSARLMMDAFEWAGFSQKKKYIYGAGLGFAFLTGIEIMDGMSSGWGYSWGDQLADACGAGLALGQEFIWKQQRIQLKFSVHQSGLAKYNPSLLGNSPISRGLKDYNGQTYWLSFNLYSFLKNTRLSFFPGWLNLAAGYGAWGMTGGEYNRVVAINPDGTILHVQRERRIYLSLDIDLTQIHVRKKWLKTVFSCISILKLPAPTLQFTKRGVKAYGIYF